MGPRGYGQIHGRRAGCSPTGQVREPDFDPSSSGNRESTLPPQLFPIPDAAGGLDRQWESELMRQHAYLPTMMGVMGNHIGEHGSARRPRLRPTVPAKVP